MRTKAIEPVTWEWLASELVKRIQRLEILDAQGAGKSFAETLDERTSRELDIKPRSKGGNARES